MTSPGNWDKEERFGAAHDLPKCKCCADWKASHNALEEKLLKTEAWLYELVTDAGIYGTPYETIEGLEEWYRIQSHKGEKIKDALRRSALEKLSKEEKIALGLDKLKL